MKEIIRLTLPPSEAYNDETVKLKALEHLGLDQKKPYFVQILKRSIDARKKPVKILLQIAVSEQEEKSIYYKSNPVSSAKTTIHIIGSGPAGLFAALRAIELRIKPIIIERGKNVKERRRDLAKLTKEGLVNPESNYCFGEGGAGTYSDGKLYTRSKKRGNILKVLQWFVHFGADSSILTEAHPHIGTNKLPGIIENMRNKIISAGGEIHFNTKLTDIIIEKERIIEIELNNTNKMRVNNLILATGHSARDIFNLLDKKNIKLEAKPFALGVRIEHPQHLINNIQYHNDPEMKYLPPAAYSWVEQVNERGVYSFCMCPGGIIAPCATEDGEVVTNGWSPSKRNNPFANSGIVVEVRPEDIEKNSSDPFICLNFQKLIEQKAWEMGSKNQQVPTQRLIDYLEKKKSDTLPESSYHRGIVSSDLNKLFPDFINERLRQAFRKVGGKMKGYLHPDALLHAPESRTSSPIKIPRNEETLQHIEISGLYPCGEGAGYAGGIVSAAIDGIRCAEALDQKLT